MSTSRIRHDGTFTAVSAFGKTAYAITGLRLLAVLYFASYYLMVQPEATIHWDDGSPRPVCRFGGAAAETFYPPGVPARSPDSAGVMASVRI